MNIISLNMTTLFTTILTVITGLMYFVTYKKSHKTSKHLYYIMWVFMSISLMQGAILYGTETTYKPNKKVFDKLNIVQILQLNSKSIKTKEPDKIEKGQLIVIVKYGCKDCSAVKETMLKYIKDQNIKDIYFVSNESKIAKELITKANISQLPTLVYVRNNSIAKDIDLNHTIVYTIDDKGKTVFDEPAFSRMLNRQLNKE